MLAVSTANAPRPLSSLHLGLHLHALAVLNGGSTIIFGTHGATAISRDGGRTFALVSQLAGLDAMEIAAAKAGRVIAVAGHNGAMISRDGGVTWQTLSAHLPGKDTHGLGIDASDPNRILAYVVDEGVFETRDGGATWAKLSNPPQMPMGTATIAGKTLMIPAMTMYPAMGMSGILRSSDDGGHWSWTNRNLGGMSLADDPQQKNVIYFSGLGALDVSKDGGKSWAAIPLPKTAEVVAPGAGGALYAAGYPGKRGIVWRSRDGGKTWVRISA